MRTELILTAVAAGCVCASALAEEHDYYKCLRYPKKLVPGVGRDKVEQEGGPNAVGYKRRTVHWWPRKGQDIVDIPEGVPLRTWTRNKGHKDKEALAGVCRNWTTSDSETFKAHLIGFRGFGVPTLDPRHNHVLAPAAVLRMENGERRAILAYPPFSMMVSEEDHEFICKIWEKAFPKLQASVSQEEYEPDSQFNQSRPLVLETKHFRFQSDAETEFDTLWWVRPHEPEKQNLFRKASLEFAENMWTHIEAAGASMPYWRHEGPEKKYVVNVRLAVSGGWAGGGFGTCELRDNTGGPRNLGLAHEFYHGQPGGGWIGLMGESLCHGGRHFNIPGETLMFSANFCYPWRNVSSTAYQASLWFFALGDSPNWGYGIISVSGCLAAAAEPTAYHTIARLGQKRGLWENGVKGFGDFFGRYAARMATCDFVMQYPIRSKYGMPEMTFLYPVYGQPARYCMVITLPVGRDEVSIFHTLARLGEQRGLFANGIRGVGDMMGEFAARRAEFDCELQDTLRRAFISVKRNYLEAVDRKAGLYRIPWAEAPEPFGANIIRLVPEKRAEQIAVDFRGFYDPDTYSDWRACIVAVGAQGKVRYRRRHIGRGLHRPGHCRERTTRRESPTIRPQPGPPGTRRSKRQGTLRRALSASTGETATAGTSRFSSQALLQEYSCSRDGVTGSLS